MFGILRLLRPSRGRSSIRIESVRSGAARYYEVGLRPGRDGSAAALLREQIRPFMSPRLVASEKRFDAATYFYPDEYRNRVLTNVALRLAACMGGIAAVISPSGDVETALRFLPCCGEVRIICPFRIDEPELEWFSTLAGLRGCGIILCFSGLAGLGAPEPFLYEKAAVFTNASHFFPGCAAIDGFRPRIPPALGEIPPGVNPLDFVAACHTLGGMYGLAALPPLRLFSNTRAVSLDEIWANGH